MDKLKPENESSVAEHLVARIISGDQSAESEMVERYHRGLLAMLFNRSRDRSLAQDIAQETWLLVIQKVRTEQLRNPQKLASFIVQIGKNQLIMHYRSSGRESHSADVDLNQLGDQQSAPEQVIANRQLGATIAKLFSGMHAARDAELLQRFYQQGDSKQQLCDEYNLSKLHFDRVLYRARHRFKQLWAKQTES